MTLKEHIELLNEEFAKINKMIERYNVKSGKPGQHKEYMHIDANEEPRITRWYNTNLDNYRYQNQNIYQPGEEVKVIKLRHKIVELREKYGRIKEGDEFLFINYALQQFAIDSDSIKARGIYLHLRHGTVIHKDCTEEEQKEMVELLNAVYTEEYYR